MTSYKITSVLWILLLTSWGISAQNSLVRKAQNSFERFDYSNAAELYERAINKGYQENDAYLNLADSYYLNANYPEAAEWYGKLADKDRDALDLEHIHRYALALKSLGDYDESDQWMFELAKADDYRGDRFTQGGKDYIEKINERSGRFKVKNMDINSEGSDFAPSFYAETLVFSSTRDTNIVSNEIHGWNEKRFLNLYSASSSHQEGNLAPARKFSDKLNTRAHESSTAFTKDGNTVYFTRNNSKNNSFSRDEEGVSRLKIYKGTFTNGKWSNIRALPFNNKSYSVAHPTLNAAEDKLYFASDMPGTYGKSDIWVVDVNADGSYGTPINLGDKVNTGGKETFPFVTKEGVLYFSSDGHPGLGGLDVFATSLNKEPYIVNIGEPVNSMSDDFSFIMNSETKKGYFASDRKGGKGSDDIYAFIETKELKLDCESVVRGVVKDKTTDALIPGSKVILMNQNNEVLGEVMTGEDGAFELQGDCLETEYLVTASKEEYEADKIVFNNKGEQDVDGIGLMLLPFVDEAPIGTDLAKHMNIEPIYFDLDKSYIRKDAEAILERVVAYMKSYPETRIEVGSHTDSRADTKYNIALSQRRAKATVAYIVSRGIASSRISGKGFGESKLTNKCAQKIKCNESEHQQNRRSEFILIE